jgi:hypothetical protein
MGYGRKSRVHVVFSRRMVRGGYGYEGLLSERKCQAWRWLRVVSVFWAADSQNLDYGRRDGVGEKHYWNVALVDWQLSSVALIYDCISFALDLC